MNAAEKSPWLAGSPDPASTHRLFCFPHAGGGAAAFFPWKAALRAQGIEVCAVQLPGREARFREQPTVLMLELARAVCDGIAPFCTPPFSFFGHSMGTMIALEVLHEMIRRGHALPCWLLLSASVPPHRRKLERLHALPGEEFIPAVAQRYGGLPREVLANRELLDLVTPTLRADFELIERYRFEPGAPLPVKIAAFAGREDPLTPPDEMLGWRLLTAEPAHFRLTYFDGDHFFLHPQRSLVLAEIARLLACPVDRRN